MDIEHFAINIPDPQAMAEWYVAHLGVRIVRQATTPPFIHFLADSSERTVIEIYHNTKAAVPDYSSMDMATFHIAWKTGDIVKDRDRLLAAGGSSATEVIQNAAGDSLLFMRDPWGVPLQLIQRASPLI